MRKSKGQEAVEFVFITALIFFAALLVMLIFGEAISDYVTNKSSVATTAKNTAQSYDTDVKYETENTGYMGTIQTHKPPPLPLPRAPEGTETLVLDNGLQIIGIPSNTAESIQTTGSSGTTDAVVNTLDALVMQLKSIAEQNPDRPEYQNLADQAYKLAEQGHLVADAEEWYELAAQRLTSQGTIMIPEDNMLCEDGGLVTEIPAGQCDRDVSDYNFIYSSLYTGYIDNLLDTHLGNFNAINTTLQTNSSSITDQQVTDIISIINILGGEINNIASNVKTSVDLASQSIKNLDDLNNSVASKTTDLKAELIKKYGQRLADKKAQAPVNEPVNEPVDNGSI